MMVSYFMSMVMIMLSVAFFTLLERKILGYTHFRLGPNKLGYSGMFQPFSDALKLFSKENIKLLSVNYWIYLVSPMLGLLLMMSFWMLFPFWGENLSSNISGLFCFCIASLTIYFLLSAGWASSSKYSMIGAYRSVAQAISYEVNIFFVMFLIFFFLNSYSFSIMPSFSKFKLFMLLWIFVIWLIIILAESNRTPFDFSEGESELVSGFNTEYSGGLFSIIFIIEYGSILFFSSLTVLMFMSLSLFSFKIMLISIFYIWIRATLPRLRYDFLMMMSWKGILPMVMSLFVIYFIFSYKYLVKMFI